MVDAEELAVEVAVVATIKAEHKIMAVAAVRVKVAVAEAKIKEEEDRDRSVDSLNLIVKLQ